MFTKDSHAQSLGSILQRSHIRTMQDCPKGILTNRKIGPVHNI